MNTRNFQIPIHVAEGQRSKIRELQLFYSSDQGSTWHQTAVAPPDKEDFKFYAPADGMYWFNICVIDTNGKPDQDIYKAPPRQKVQVDTLKPNLRIVLAERQGDDIVVSWETQEDHPDLASLKLEYRTPDAPASLWSAVPVSPALNGQKRFPSPTPGPLLVRMQILDLAGNAGLDMKEIAAKAGGLSTPSSGIVPAGAKSTSGTPGPDIPTPGSSGSAMSTGVPSLNSHATNSSPTGPTPGGTTAGTSVEPVPPLQPAVLTQVEQHNGTVPAPTQPAESRNGTERAWSPVQPVPSPPNAYAMNNANRSTAAVENLNSSASFAAAGRKSNGAMPPLQIANSNLVMLDYEIKAGPSGVGTVELYLTRDEGQTWDRYDENLKVASPMTVNLPGEGVYGLRLVAGNRAGLGRRPPRPGTPPQMLVEVDTTPPIARLLPLKMDPVRTDALVITWEASDRNLTPNPITLQWTDRPNGNWKTIEADVAYREGQGRYVWSLPPDHPDRVYVRLLVRDKAGNVGMAETREPVDLQEPEVQIKAIKTVRQQ
jgi:hypothetical protein